MPKIIFVLGGPGAGKGNFSTYNSYKKYFINYSKIFLSPKASKKRNEIIQVLFVST